VDFCILMTQLATLLSSVLEMNLTIGITPLQSNIVSKSVIAMSAVKLLKFGMQNTRFAIPCFFLLWGVPILWTY
jgi:hypothetical protein